MKGKTCCVTGHRDLPQNEINKIKTALAHEIDAAVTDGFTCFMSGFADGVDQYFVELVLERKQTTPALELIAVIPYRKRLDSLNKKTRTRELLEAWINHFMKFSTMEDIDRRAVMQLIRSIRVMGKDELHIEFNYQDEYQKAISLAEQIATKNEERMVG